MSTKLNLILAQYLDDYKTLLNQLENNSPIEENLVLELLNHRSQIQEFLKEKPRISPGHQQSLLTLDKKLKSLATKIINSDVIDLEDYRQSFNPQTTEWWWYLETQLPPHPLTRYDSFWKGLTLAGWTFNLALLSNIISRFISEGTGISGALFIVLPTLLTLLQARNDLTDGSESIFSYILEKLRFKSQRTSLAKLISTIILTGIIFIIWLMLPMFSQVYNILGKQAYEVGDLGQAEAHYQQAISINPDKAIAHYNLGNLYEDLNDLKKAKNKYSFAVKSGIAEANNNLGRLLIQQKQYSEAVSLLKKGLSVPDKSTQTNYNLFKNLGWARLEQKDHQSAITYLKSAITIDDSYQLNEASAHCLLAQALEFNKDKTEALEQWDLCCQKGRIINPDEDQWLLMGRQKKIKTCLDNG